MSTVRKLPYQTLPGTSHPDKYRVIFDQVSDAIVTVFPDGKIDAVNHAAEELTGFMKAELKNCSIQVLMPKGNEQSLPERTRVLTLEQFQNPGTYEDIVIQRSDGYRRIVDMSIRTLGEGTEGISVAVFRDVTEKKNMERELITKHSELQSAYIKLEKTNAELQATQQALVQAGKMAALGELATGIAHELNQPLQGIRGYAQELKSLVTSNAEVETGFKEIISSVDKMAQIIQYLRAFVRKSVEKHEMTDVHTVIEEAIKMLARQFSARGIEVHREFHINLPKIYANPLQLEQVFINLATNARDAIEATGRGRGKVSVCTRDVGKFVEIVFQDDGIGMDEKTRSKAFNPFFTTKDVGKGMGLGLSLSFGMISKIHGSMVIESELGKGTAFVIRIPKDFRELG